RPTFRDLSRSLPLHPRASRRRSPSPSLSDLSSTRARHAAPPGVGEVTACGATPHTEAPQAIIRRRAPRRLRAVPAGTRHRRPSPLPTAGAAPGALAHPGNARRDSPRGRDECHGSARPAGPRAIRGLRSTHPGGVALPGGDASARRRRDGPPARHHARLVPGPPRGPAPFPLDDSPLLPCSLLLARSRTSSSLLAAIIACNGVSWRPP